MRTSTRAFALLYLALLGASSGQAQNASAPATPTPPRDLFERRLREDQEYLVQLRSLYGADGQYGGLIAKLRNATELVNLGGGTPNDAARRTIADLDEYQKTVNELQSILEKAIAARMAEPRDYSDVQATCRIQMDTIQGRPAAGSVSAVEGYQARVFSRLREMQENRWQGVGGQPREVLEPLFRNALNLMIQIQRRCSNLRDEIALAEANKVIDAFNRSTTPEGVDRGSPPSEAEQLCQRLPELRELPPGVCIARIQPGGLPAVAPRRGDIRVLGGGPDASVLESTVAPKNPGDRQQTPGGPRPGGGPRPTTVRPGG